MPLGAVHPIIARSGATKQSMARHRKIEDGLLRRSAPRNDDQIYHPGSQTHLRDLAAGARVLLYVLPSENQRAWGMPGARCTRSLACKMGREHTSIVTVGSPDQPGIPARNGVNGFLRDLVSAESARMCERAVLTNRPSLDLSPFVLKGLGEPDGERGTDPVSSSTRTVAGASSPDRARKGAG